jgi:hypothetical protein
LACFVYFKESNLASFQSAIEITQEDTMSGMRYYNFREGDRSEYLANYLLSGIGLVTPFPRQEDIGIDFYCSLADQERGRLTFGFPYLVQVKSISETELSFGSVKDGKWQHEDILWLFRQELPLFIGFVDKSAIRIDLFNTSAFWFTVKEHPTCSQLVFRPRRDPQANQDVGKPSVTALNDWPTQDAGDGMKHEVDLGQPIISLHYSDLENNDKLRRMKDALRAVIYIEQDNLMYRRMALPYFNWILRSKPNEGVHPAWAYFGTGPEMTMVLLKNIAPSIISLALNLKLCGNAVDLQNLKALIAKLPGEMIHRELREQNPDIFGNASTG